MEGLIKRAETIFKGHEDLLLGFHEFLPKVRARADPSYHAPFRCPPPPRACFSFPAFHPRRGDPCPRHRARPGPVQLRPDNIRFPRNAELRGSPIPAPLSGSYACLSRLGLVYRRPDLTRLF